MTEYIPQIIVLCLLFFNIAEEAINHGEEKKPRKKDFWTTLISSSITFALLYWGGFFD